MIAPAAPVRSRKCPLPVPVKAVLRAMEKADCARRAVTMEMHSLQHRHRRLSPHPVSYTHLMTLLCQVLSTESDNLWTFETKDGKSIAKAVAYLNPFLADKSKWPLKSDVQAWEGWPARQPHLLFAGLALGEQAYLDLWKKLPADPTDPEVQRNIGITQPVLWVK